MVKWNRLAVVFLTFVLAFSLLGGLLSFFAYTTTPLFAKSEVDSAALSSVNREFNDNIGTSAHERRFLIFSAEKLWPSFFEAIFDFVERGHKNFESTALQYSGVDLIVTQLVSSDPVVVGQLLTYTAIMTNSGPGSAMSVVLTNELALGLIVNQVFPSQGNCWIKDLVVNCDVGDLSSGASATVAIQITPTIIGHNKNTIYVTTSVTDTNLANNIITETTSIVNFYYSNFSSVNDLLFFGDALQSSGKLQLTPPLNDKTGAVWYTSSLLIKDGFETNFDFQIAEVVGGAEGLTFVLQNDDLSVVGNPAAGLGYDGIEHSLVIEFDTYLDALGDPNDNHISVHNCESSVTNSSNHICSIASTTAISDLNDGLIHSVRIRYDPGTLTVFLDDFDQAVLTASLSLSDIVGLEEGRAWVGFTAATGGLWQRQDILNWSFAATQSYPPMDMTLEGPATVTQDLPTAFSIAVNPTATLPLTYVWDSFEQTPVTHVDGLYRTDEMIYTWPDPGMKTITVTASNEYGAISETHMLLVAPRTCWVRINDGITDYVTPQAAVDAAADGDLVKVAGTCTQVESRLGTTQTVYINKSITVQGGYTLTDWVTSNPMVNPTTLNALGQGRVVYITGDITPTLVGLNIAGGLDAFLGGGVYVENAHLTIINSTISGNEVTYDNSLPGHGGGGLYLFNADRSLVISSSIRNNTVYRQGGGALVQSSDDVRFQNSSISGNQAVGMYGEGGGIYWFDGNSAELTNVEFLTNTARHYSGLYLAGAQAVLDKLIVRGNHYGAIGGYCGGLYLDDFDGGVLRGSLIQDNQAYAYGGGICVGSTSSNYRLKNNIIVSNSVSSALANGSGAFVLGEGGKLDHQTFVGNMGGSGQALYVGGTDIVVRNSIFATHTLGSKVGSGDLTIDHSVFFDSGNPPFSGNIITNEVRVCDPYFVSAEEGDYRLGLDSGSPHCVIDQGLVITDVIVDFEGDPRPQSSGYDIGADEYTPLDIVSNFTATPHLGGTPLTVVFSNLTSGDYQTCTWDFGDGAYGNVCVGVTHTYTTPGAYTVSLSVAGLGGTDILTLSDLIVVYSPLLDASVMGAAEGFEAVSHTLTASVAPLTATQPITYVWDIDDHASIIHADRLLLTDSISFTFSSPGSYGITMTASNAANVVTATFLVSVTSWADLAVNKSGNPDPTWVGYPLTYTIVITNLGPGVASHVLLTDVLPSAIASLALVDQQQSCKTQFSDGGQSESEYLLDYADIVDNVLFSTFNEFTHGSVFNDISGRENPSFCNSVTCPSFYSQGRFKKVVDFDTGNDVASYYQPYLVKNSTTYLSEFMSASLLSQPYVSVFSSQGLCTITDVLVCDMGELRWGDVVSVTAVVTPSARGVLTNVVSVSGDIVDLVLFNNMHSITTTVDPPTLDVGLEAVPVIGSVPLPVTFTNQSRGFFDTCLWEFGDGESAEGCDVVSHTYTCNGFYAVTLRVSELGGVNSITSSTYVTVTPQAIFFMSLDDNEDAVAPFDVVFTDTSLADLTHWLWDFGDGMTSTQRSPTHTYMHGAYTASLTVSGVGGYDVITDLVLINVHSEARDVYLGPRNPTTIDSLKVSYRYDDFDGDGEGETRIRWTRDGITQTFWNDQVVLPDTATLPSESWCVTVQPYDGFVYGDMTELQCTTLNSNTPPEVLELMILPSTPTANDDLVLTYQPYYFDFDGDPEVVTRTQISWYRDGVLQPGLSDQSLITGWITLPDETWCATARPYDGIHYGLTTAPVCVTIPGGSGNTQPEARNVRIMPLHPEILGTLSVEYAYFDLDNPASEDLDKRQIRWYRDGIPQPYLQNQESVFPSDTYRGESWCVTVRVSDGEAYSNVSDQVCTIISATENPLPWVENQYIYPDGLLNSDNLYLYYRYQDIENQFEMNTQIRWYCNSVLQPALNDRSYVPFEHTQSGDSWYARIRPRDNQGGYGYQVQTPIVSIQGVNNNEPDATDAQVKLKNYTAGVVDQYTIAVDYDYYDINENPESKSQIYWYKVGENELELYEEYNGLTVIPYSMTAVGDTWFAFILPGDGMDVGPYVPARSVTLGEVVMSSVSESYMTPGIPGPDDVLKLHYVYQSSDGEPEGETLFRWIRMLEGNQTEVFTNSQPLLRPDMTSVGDEWCAVVIPYDVRGNQGEPVASGCVTIAEYGEDSPAQVISSTTYVEPWPPRDGEALRLFYDYFDPDGDLDESTQIRWYRKEEGQDEWLNQGGFGRTSIPGSRVHSGDQWRIFIKPCDDSDNQCQEVMLETPPVNKPPICQGATIDNLSPTTKADVTVTPEECYDADGNADDIYYEVSWYRGQELSPRYISEDTLLPYDHTSPGEVWHAAVVPCDFYQCGSPVTSTAVTIVGVTVCPAPEIVPTFAISGQMLSVEKGECEGWLPWIDKVYWYRNNVHQTSYDYPTSSNSEALPSNITQSGERWYAMVTTCEEFGGCSDLIKTSTVVIQSSSEVPNCQGAVLLPNYPDQFKDLQVRLNGCSAAQGKLRIKWYRNGLHQPQYDYPQVVDEQNLPATATSPRDEWYALVELCDEFEVCSKEMQSNMVTISQIRYVYLPRTTSLYPIIYDDFYEPNDTHYDAPRLDFGRVTTAYPEDLNDWYLVYLKETASLRIRVDNYYGDRGQLVVYWGQCIWTECTPVFLANDGRGKTSMALPNVDRYALSHLPERPRDEGLPPGPYYIWIRTDEGCNSNVPYELLPVYVLQ